MILSPIILFVHIFESNFKKDDPVIVNKETQNQKPEIDFIVIFMQLSSLSIFSEIIIKYLFRSSVAFYYYVVLQYLTIILFAMASKNWLPEEEKMLDELVKKGEHCWLQIANQINQKFPRRTKTSKQCRERYHDYISFKGKMMKKKDWGPEQQRIFWQYIQRYGLSWTKICSALVQDKAKIIGSCNNLKNKFYASLKSIMHRINSSLGFKAVKSYIKWTPFKRFVCLNFYTQMNASSNTENYELCKQIIERALLKRFDMNQDFLQQISKEVFNFCKLNRHLNARKLVVFKKNKRSVPIFKLSNEEALKKEDEEDEGVQAKVQEVSENQQSIVSNHPIVKKQEGDPIPYQQPRFYPVMVPYPVFVPVSDMHLYEGLFNCFPKNQPEQEIVVEKESIKREELSAKNELKKEVEVDESSEVRPVQRPRRSVRSLYNRKKQRD